METLKRQRVDRLRRAMTAKVWRERVTYTAMSFKLDFTDVGDRQIEAHLDHARQLPAVSPAS